MRKLYLLLIGSAFVLSGCVARTYPITKDRVDQQLNTGNRGYILGSHPGGDEGRKETRNIRVFEIEIGKPYANKNKAAVTEAAPAAADLTAENPAPEPAADTGAFQKYTVGKNDTLQKISQKFYGTTKRWTKIYDANKDVLKAPDKVYPGQVLNIPAEGMKAPEAHKENLK